MLVQVMRRCLMVDNIDAVVCAVPEGPQDDLVAQEADRCGVAVFRGSESDVLGRYYSAAVAHHADVVVRVTSDCPVIDPQVTADVVNLRAATGVDYATNNLVRTWPHGLDVECFAFSALERAWNEAREPQEREHVNPYMRSAKVFTQANLPGPGSGLQHERWTLDFPEDYAFFQALFDELPSGIRWDWRDVLDVVRRRPDIAALNAMHRSY